MYKRFDDEFEVFPARLWRTGQIENYRAAANCTYRAGQHGAGRVLHGVGAHGFGNALCLSVAYGKRGFGGYVPGRKSRAACRHDKVYALDVRKANEIADKFVIVVG